MLLQFCSLLLPLVLPFWWKPSTMYLLVLFLSSFSWWIMWTFLPHIESETQKYVMSVFFFFFFFNCKCLDDCIGSRIWYVGLLVVIDLDASAYTLWIWNCNVLCERKIIFNSIMSITFSSLDMLLSGCWLWGYHHCFPERDRTLQESYLIIRGYDASDHDMLPAPWVFCLN